MKKYLLLSALTAVSLMSCTDNAPDVNPAATGDGSIKFNSYLGRNPGRGGNTTIDNLVNFGILAYNNDGAAYETGQIPDFMYNQEVVKGAEGWTYEPLKYWPSDPAKKISFFAYAPYTAFPNHVAEGASNIASISSNAFEGDPNLTFVVGKDISKHIDLVYAKCLDKTNSAAAVDLNFKHALSRVAFKCVAWEPVAGESYDDNTTVVVNAVKLATTRQMATLNMYTGEWSDPVDDATLHAYTISTRNGNITNNLFNAGDCEAHSLNLNGDYIMMLPDLSGNDRYALFVDYTTTTVDPSLKDGKSVVRNLTARYLEPNFQAGKAYTITLHLGMNGYSGPDDGIVDPEQPIPNDPDPDPDDPIDPSVPGAGNFVSFTTTVTEWEDGVGSDVSYNPASSVLSARQEGFHLVGFLGHNDWSRADVEYNVASIKRKGGGEDILVNHANIAEGNFTIPMADIDFNKVVPNVAYVLTVESSLGQTYSANVSFKYACCEFTINVPFSGSSFTVPFAQSAAPATMAFAWGDGTQSAELSSISSFNHSHAYELAGSHKVKVLALQDNPMLPQTPIFGFYNYGSYAMLESIDSPLLNSGQSSFARAFYNCEKLVSIPEDLFANNPQGTDFNSTFFGCQGLLTIPAGLFDYTPNATDFSSTFNYCSGVTSNVPELWNTHTSATSHAYCFSYCDKAANYQAIPAGWK